MGGVSTLDGDIGTLGYPLPPPSGCGWEVGTFGYPLPSSRDLVVGGRYLGQRGVGTLGYLLPLSGLCRARYLGWGDRYLGWGVGTLRYPLSGPGGG